MLIIGSKFFKWGNDLTPDTWKCGECGTMGQFVKKQGMRFVTLFFVIPILPISGISHMVQCPNCKTLYQEKQQ
ncbi:MAG: zinc-ribbon domain-containing protein [Anaerolineae bacterium]|nr:zinc-ribbon domain-containing protein [Anaerolineae bacterium]